MGKRYVHVVLPDGSTVERGSANRVYTHAIIRTGATRDEAVERLTKYASDLAASAITYALKARTLADGHVVKTEAVTYGTRALIGGVQGLPEVTITAGHDSTVEETQKEWVDKYLLWHDDHVQRASRQYYAAEWLKTQPEEFVCSNTDVDLVREYGPGVYGFSSTESGAHSRARTETKHARWGNIEVVPVVEGRSAPESPRGRVL